jgi:tetrapyrrole methylase family protein/MazG family protein
VWAGRVVVVGLGPGDPGLLTVATREAIEACGQRFVRTTRHPSAPAVEPAEAFDALYESAATFDEVYRGIVARLVTEATAGATVLYAVPGSPMVAERTVELLRSDARVTDGTIGLDVLPAMSFLDLAWARLGVDPVEVGARLVDGHRFATEAAGQTGPLLVAQCDTTLVLSDIKLSLDDGPDVVVLARLGLPDESVTTVAWHDLDRAVDPDHLTSLWIPTLAAPVAGEMARFVELVRTLRRECPWDRRQTHRSLTRHLLEETYEVLEAIDELDGDGSYDHLEEELGDLLFQVVFHATLAGEQGAFELADVVTGIHDKLVRRHPQVFGGPAAGLGWEQIKAAEKGRSSVMDGVPGNLPALLHAHKVQYKASAAGYDRPDPDGALAKVGDRAAGVRAALATGAGPEDAALHGEVGDLLFAAVSVARLSGVDPEAALRAASEKFRCRFAALEVGVGEVGGSPDEAVIDRLWGDTGQV